jgi:exopolyphosphatase/guanosine-5'-triphosphate,3'-diphosphate pyrophosphatase
MKKIGVIDIGSNSMRLIIVQINENRSFRIIDELKETVRLGMDLSENGDLNEFRIRKALDALYHFKSLATSYETEELIVVATEAVRKASNQKAFLERVKNELNISIRVLRGEEEAYYNYVGAINTLDLTDALIMDIGGASTELILVHNRKLKECISLPFGAINLTGKFGLINTLDKETEDKLIEFLESSYSKIDWLAEVNDLPLIGIGGTMRSICNINKKEKNYPLDITHNYFLESDEIIQIYNIVKAKDSEKRKKIKGLSKDRADIFLGAAAAIKTLVKFCNINNIYISGSGLREGLVYDYIFPEKNIIDNILDLSIHNTITNYNLNEIHGMHVFNLSKKLYTQLEPIHNIKTMSAYKILKTAAILHEIGTNINFYGKHKHSFYMFLNSPLNGLSHKELLIAALINIAIHKENLNINNSNYSKLLDKNDIDIILKLGIILKLADSFDRKMDSNIEDIKCRITENTVYIKIQSKFNADLELATARKASFYFGKVFNKILFIE